MHWYNHTEHFIHILNKHIPKVLRDLTLPEIGQRRKCYKICKLIDTFGSGAKLIFIDMQFDGYNMGYKAFTKVRGKLSDVTTWPLRV